MFETNRVWDYAQSKKILKENLKSLKEKALDIIEYIVYKVKNYRQEYEFYKKTKQSREKVIKAAKAIDTWDRYNRVTGNPPLKEDLGQGIVYAGDYDRSRARAVPELKAKHKMNATPEKPLEDDAWKKDYYSK